VYAGIDPLTGRQRYLKETAADEDEADVVLTRLLGRVDENRHPKSAITVGEAIRRWLEVARHEDTTRDRNEDLIRIYIEPVLGHLQAGALDAELLETFYARLQRCRELCSGRPRHGHTCRPLAGSTTARSTTYSAARSNKPSGGDTSTSIRP